MEALCMYISPLCKLLTILRNFCIFSIIIWTNLIEIRRDWKNLTDVRRISKKWNWYTAYSKNHQGKQLQHMYLIYSRCDFFFSHMSNMSEHPCHNLSNTDKQIFTCRHCMAKFYDPIQRWRHSKSCKKDAPTKGREGIPLSNVKRDLPVEVHVNMDH